MTVLGILLCCSFGATVCSTSESEETSHGDSGPASSVLILEARESSSGSSYIPEVSRSTECSASVSVSQGNESVCEFCTFFQLTHEP